MKVVLIFRVSVLVNLLCVSRWKSYKGVLYYVLVA